MTLDDLMKENLSNQVLEVQKDCIKAVQENALLRKLLWLRHDREHFAGLYGDDGEMQCGQCGVDFKLLPAESIQDVWHEQAFVKLAAMNQCDGCKAGKPLNGNGNHVMSEHGGYQDLMACQAYKYKEKP